MKRKSLKSKKFDRAANLSAFFLTILARTHSSLRAQNEEAYLALQRSGITSFDTLVRRFEGLPESQRRTAIMALGAAGNRRVVPRLLRLLKTGDPSLKFDVREALTEIGGERAFKGLKKILFDEKQSPDARYEACYALAHQWHKVVPSVFFAIAMDEANDSRLRGQAVEGIAIHGRYYGKRDRSRSAEVLLECLDDSTAEVRFWAVFGVACLNIKESLPKLRKLAHDDHAVASLGWSVAEEARDAVYCITKGHWPKVDASDRRFRAGPKKIDHKSGAK